MIELIRRGDATNHGGKVVSASQTMSYGDIAVARKGDRINCPQHPEVRPNVIEKGDEEIIDEVVPVVRADHRSTCDCFPHNLEIVPDGTPEQCEQLAKLRNQVRGDR